MESTSVYNKNTNMGAGEVIQWIRALVAPPEDWGLIPSIHRLHKTICNSNFRGYSVLFWPLKAPGMHMVEENTYVCVYT